MHGRCRPRGGRLQGALPVHDGDLQRLASDEARARAISGIDCLAPRAAERDRTGRFPLEDLADLAALGPLAMKVPTDDGGSGTDNVGYVLAMEAVAEAARPRR